jgi:hypothetical protein
VAPAAGEDRQRKRGLQTRLLRYLAAVGAVAAKENNEAGRGMLEEATAQKDLLVSRGLSETLLEDLEAALTEFEHTLEASRTGRREHVGASADLQAVATQISDQVRLLDGLVRYRFGDNAELMGAWASARNVLGPFRSKGESQGSGEPGAGAGPAEVKPAA